MFQQLLQNTLEIKRIIIYFESEITFRPTILVNYTKLLPMNNKNLTLLALLATDNGDGRGPLVSKRRHASSTSLVMMRRKGGITNFILALLFAISICSSITGVNGAELEQEDNRLVPSIFHDQVNIFVFSSDNPIGA